MRIAGIVLVAAAMHVCKLEMLGWSREDAHASDCGDDGELKVMSRELDRDDVGSVRAVQAVIMSPRNDREPK